jgi:uncharacterized protein (DUF4415 family)
MPLRAKLRAITRSSKRVVNADMLAKNPRIKARMDRELAELARKPESSIDLSDAPELHAAEWKNPIHGMEAWLKAARAGALYKPVKRAVSMRLDADVVAWLKQAGPGYQTRANQILREKMIKELPR